MKDSDMIFLGNIEHYVAIRDVTLPYVTSFRRCDVVWPDVTVCYVYIRLFVGYRSSRGSNGLFFGDKQKLHSGIR